MTARAVLEAAGVALAAGLIAFLVGALVALAAFIDGGL